MTATLRLRHHLVLASASPRRRALLRGIGIEFEIEPADIDETRAAHEAPLAYALRMAREKAEAVAQRRVHPPGEDIAPALVLGADTIVVIDGGVLGKPVDAEDAVRLLSSLVGRSHEVITAVAARSTAGGTPLTEAVSSHVTMRGAEQQEIREYVATGEPLDKAGAYAVQGEGRRFVTEIEGSESNVIGLPLDETLALLARLDAALDAP